MNETIINSDNVKHESFTDQTSSRLNTNESKECSSNDSSMSQVVDDFDNFLTEEQLSTLKSLKT